MNQEVEERLDFDDVELFLVKTGLGFDHDLLFQLPLQLLDSGPFLLVKEVCHIGMGLDHEAVATKIRGGSLDFTEDVVTNRDF